jgi:hypothetical protein
VDGGLCTEVLATVGLGLWCENTNEGGGLGAAGELEEAEDDGSKNMALAPLEPERRRARCGARVPTGLRTCSDLTTRTQPTRKKDEQIKQNGNAASTRTQDT